MTIPANQIPRTEPDVLRAGDTWSWLRTLADYPANAWTLHYYLRAVNATMGTPVLDLTSSADTTDPLSHSITALASDTANLATGEWSWQCAARDIATGLVRVTLDTGTLTVQTNLEAADGSIDNRTHNQKMLDAICALLEKRATKLEESYQISGRMVKWLTPKELEEQKGIYTARVRQEKRNSGELRTSTDVNVRFGASCGGVRNLPRWPQLGG